MISLILGLFAGTGVSQVLQLQTGGGTALNRLLVPIAVPSHYPSSSIQFEFSFFTNERVIPGEFLDSFTISIRNSNRTAVATILTVDRFGVAWRPAAAPGGLAIPEVDLLVEPVSSPAVPPGPFEERFSFRVRVELPAVFRTEPFLVVLSLFDNQDAETSLAMVDGLRVKPGIHMPLMVESSADVTGPYARETTLSIDRLARTITLPGDGKERFFRLFGPTASRVASLTRSGADWVVGYEADLGSVSLRLEGANQPGGPFQPVTNAVFNMAARTVSVPLLNAPGFFRIVGSHPARITSDEVTGQQRVLGFAVHPQPPSLHSSAQPEGPFAQETGVQVEEFTQRLIWRSGRSARFYRLVSGLPLEIRAIVRSGNSFVLQYEEP